MAHRAMNCRATSICITDYIILFDNPIAAIFRNDPSCFAGSRMSLASCEPHSSETSNQLDAGISYRTNERVGSTGAYHGHSNVGVTSGNLSGSRWGIKGALFGRLGMLVVQTQLGFFNAPRLTKCIPLIDQVGDSAAFLSL
jgi:hypothetical protein